MAVAALQVPELQLRDLGLLEKEADNGQQLGEGLQQQSGLEEVYPEVRVVGVWTWVS